MASIQHPEDASQELSCALLQTTRKCINFNTKIHQFSGKHKQSLSLDARGKLRPRIALRESVTAHQRVELFLMLIPLFAEPIFLNANRQFLVQNSSFFQSKNIIYQMTNFAKRSRCASRNSRRTFTILPVLAAQVNQR